MREVVGFGSKENQTVLIPDGNSRKPPIANREKSAGRDSLASCRSSSRPNSTASDDALSTDAPNSSVSESAASTDAENEEAQGGFEGYDDNLDTITEEHSLHKRVDDGKLIFANQ